MDPKATLTPADSDTELLIRKVRALSAFAWDGECEWPIVERWLHQYDGSTGLHPDQERYQMLFLLTNFLYFGTREVRELLRAMYRDVFKYRIVERLRRQNQNTTDTQLLNTLFVKELEATRFLAIGNPSESSTHLLYYFRQENHLSKRSFIHPHEAFRTTPPLALRNDSIQRYVFIDDFAGSGDQACKYAQEIAAPITKLASATQVAYYVMVATTSALSSIRALQLFTDVASVFELTEDFRAFSDTSLCYVNPPDSASQSRAKLVATHYGKELSPADPLGYNDGQLLLGFSHNIPDNTLPLFCHPETLPPRWTAPFPRHPKF